MTKPVKQKAPLKRQVPTDSFCDAALEVCALSKSFAVGESAGARLGRVLFNGPLPPKSVCAIDNVSFSVARGETLGIVGDNGSGKSTLLKILAGIQRPDRGSVTVRGKMATLLELGVGFDPEFTGRENVHLADALLGFSAKDLEERLESIAAFADIGPFLDQPVRTYSAGMKVRLAFATAIHAEPQVLVIDEVLAVGDAAFQRKCFSRIRQMQQQGVTIIFVSHDMNNTVQIASRVLMLDGGRIMALGEPKGVVSLYERFSFALPAEKEILREKVRAGGPDQPSWGVYSNGEPVARKPIVYSCRGAVIENPRITDESGNIVRILTIGRNYHYSYDVHFTRSASKVRMGMMIVAPSGLSLAGQVSHPPGQGIEVAQDKRIRQQFCFECRMVPGIYFANAGVTALIGADEVFLHRIVDAVTFKVEARQNPLFTGLMDLSCKQGKKDPKILGSKMATAPKKLGKGILILGMHRSGTSVASRMANLAGAWLGTNEELMPPGPDNPSGFWERLDVMKFNDRLLAALGRTWDTELALSPGWENDVAALPFYDTLADMITDAFEGRPFWAVKDPRLCLLLPLWKKVLAKKNIAFACLFVVRHPIEVALSLKERNGLALEKGLACWLNHNESAIEGLIGLPTGVLRFENLLLDWKAELGRAFADAGIAWPDDARAFEEAVNAFFKPQLGQKAPDKGWRGAELPEDISRLYSRLMQEPFLPGDKL